MEIKLPDGSVLKTDNDAEAEMLIGLLGLRPAPKTQADELREAIDVVKAQSYIDVYHGNGDTAVMPTMAEAEQKDVEAMLSVDVPNDLPAPAKMPRQVLPRPVAWVTELQLRVITLLRHHPEGLKTSEVATLLNWDHSKATRQTTGLERRDNGLPQLVERYGKGYRYRLTSYAMTAAYKMTTQPARMRDKVGV